MKTKRGFAITGLEIIIVLGIASLLALKIIPMAQLSDTAYKNINEDPNKHRLPITTLAEVERVKQKTEQIFAEDQITLAAKLAKSEARHTITNAELKPAIDMGENIRTAAIALLAAAGTGISTWTLGKIQGKAQGDKDLAVANATNYTPTELQTEIDKAIKLHEQKPA
jgi:hypothetical protein